VAQLVEPAVAARLEEAGLPNGKLSSGSFSSDEPLALRFSALLTEGGERLELSQTKRDKEIPGGGYKRT
jgi:hypothetical protein